MIPARAIATLAAVLLMLVPIPAAAQTPLSKSMANAYYQNCISRDDHRMSETAQDELCSCAAAMAFQNITVEDVSVMKRTLGPGRAEFNKMLVTSYGPCLQAPVEEILFNECMADKHVKEFMLRDTATLCRCTASRSGKVVAEEGSLMTQSILKQSPEMTDPLDLFLEDRTFRAKAYANLYQCLHDTAK